MKALLLLILTTAVVVAQPALAPPQVGFVRDRANHVRPVHGVAGNFVMGAPIAKDVISAAFSNSFGMLKTDSEVIVTDWRGREISKTSAPAGKALFAFSRNGQPALAYFEHTHGLVSWNGESFSHARLDISALSQRPVVSIGALGARLAAIIVSGDDGLWELRFRLDTGSLVSQSAIPGPSGAVLLLATGDLLYGSAHGVVIRKMDGSEKLIDAHLPAKFAFHQMSGGWVEVADLAGTRKFAVHLEERREKYYALPEVRQ